MRTFQRHFAAGSIVCVWRERERERENKVTFEYIYYYIYIYRERERERRGVRRTWKPPSRVATFWFRKRMEAVLPQTINVL